MAKSIEHQTNLFCWQRGFKAADLGNHPYADDLVIMTRVKDEYWQYLNANERGWFNGVWGYVYRVRRPLKNKHLVELEHISIKAEKARTRQQIQLAKIKHQRQAKV